MKFQLIVTGEHLPAFEGPIENEFESAYAGLCHMAQGLEAKFKGVSIEPVGDIAPDSASITLEVRQKGILLGNLTLNKIEGKAATELDRDNLRQCLKDLYANPSIVITGVLGVYEDIWKKKYPMDTPLGINYTLGDFRSIKGWWQLNWYAVEAVSVFVARYVRLYAMNNLDWDQETFMEESDLIAELLADNVNDLLIAKEVVKQACAKYGTSVAPDLVKSKALKVRILAEMNRLFGAPADKPMVVDDLKYD